MVETIVLLFFFFFNDTATTEIYTLSLHDALPIFSVSSWVPSLRSISMRMISLPRLSTSNGEENDRRSEEHTSELQSPCNLVCRLLLEKKKNKQEHHLRVSPTPHDPYLL